MVHILLIGIGGFAGAVSRYLISRYLNNIFSSLPLGTLTVNVIGSFVLGVIMYGISYGKTMSPDVRDMITIGFIGGLTTMSTFSYETFRLFELNQIVFSFLNLLLNFSLCFLAIFAGRYVAILITK